MLPFCIGTLTSLMDYCILNAQIPTHWKNSFTLLPKSELVKQFSDLTPVSILPIFNKILEKILFEQLSDHPEIKRIQPEVQSAYKKYHSTSTVLIKLTNNIIKNMDNAKVTFWNLWTSRRLSTQSTVNCWGKIKTLEDKK